MAWSKKQKILLPFIFLAFVYLAWQIYALFWHTSTDLQPAISSKKGTIGTAKEDTAHNGSSAMTTEQSEYLKLMNRYNLLKLKHLLLEEEAAIAAAKQRIVKSRSEISSMGGNTTWESELEGDNDPLPRASYELIYLDYQKGRWHALLNQEGHFFEVQQGMEAAQGDWVIRVDKEGVVIQRQGQLFQVTFDGVTALPATKPVGAELDIPEPVFSGFKKKVKKNKAK